MRRLIQQPDGQDIVAIQAHQEAEGYATHRARPDIEAFNVGLE